MEKLNHCFGIALSVLLMMGHGFAQSGSFAPQAGAPGSNAIHKDSNALRDWAIACEVERGWRQINRTDSGRASTGIESYATGSADGVTVVSLGDSGVAVLQFTAPMFDGEGADFAVFENGFGSGASAYLELAFVEVSSDGENYFRFPATCEMQDSVQIEGFGTADASYYDGLAGKYIAGYGTPFDIAVLPDTLALNKSAVTHVRIVDAIGSIDTNFASRDAQGAVVNDPWPTNFPSSGFDLDAVGVINSTLPVGLAETTEAPNQRPFQYIDLQGRTISDLQQFSGIYFECYENGSVLKCFKLEG